MKKQMTKQIRPLILLALPIVAAYAAPLASADVAKVALVDIRAASFAPEGRNQASYAGQGNRGIDSFAVSRPTYVR